MQNKTVVVSATDNDDYLFYLPIITWAWNRLGWDVACIYVGDTNNKVELVKRQFELLGPWNLFFQMPVIPDYRQETIAQCSRLYAADILGDIMILTSDVDMLPLSNYWKPMWHNITAYGRDLSDRHYVMCYCAARGRGWERIMELTWNISGDIKRDLDKTAEAKSEKWEEWWQVDQQLLTSRMSTQNPVHIDRGISPVTGYPIGRVDRSAWERSLGQEERIDAHLFKKGFVPENFDRIITLISECFKTEVNKLWFMEEYRQDYVKLLS